MKKETQRFFDNILLLLVHYLLYLLLHPFIFVKKMNINKRVLSLLNYSCLLLMCLLLSENIQNKR